MSTSNYKYIADDSTVYQVALPDDFAIALGETAAVGTEPYLPMEISPRFANYFCSGIGARRQAVISTTALFGALPSSLTVGGNTYKLQSAIGQQIPAFFPAFSNSPVGPQGPQGPQGAPGVNALTNSHMYVGNASNVATDVAMSGDATIANTGVLTVAANAITNSKLAQMAANSLKGNNTGSSSNAVDLTATQVTALLNLFSSTLQGMCPASGGGTTNYLRADGSWVAVPGAAAINLYPWELGSDVTLTNANTFYTLGSSVSVVATTWTTMGGEVIFSNPGASDARVLLEIASTTGNIFASSEVDIPAGFEVAIPIHWGDTGALSKTIKFQAKSNLAGVIAKASGITYGAPASGNINLLYF